MENLRKSKEPGGGTGANAQQAGTAAELSAKDAACRNAKSEARKNTDPCDTGCQELPPLVESCDYISDPAKDPPETFPITLISSGSHDGAAWFQACILEYMSGGRNLAQATTTCEELVRRNQHSDNPHFSIKSTKANAKVTRICIPKPVEEDKKLPGSVGIYE